MKILDINRLATKLLTEITPVNALIGFDDNCFGGGSEETREAYYEVLEEYGVYISGKKHGDEFRAEVKNWHSHSVCLTGVVFSKLDVLSLANVNVGLINCPASLINGVGARYFYKALGTRTLTVELAFDYDRIRLEDEDEEIFLPVAVKSVSVNFLAETEAELDAIYENLKAQDALFQKQLTISNITGNYKNFQKLTGLDDADFYKPYVKNEKFEEFFDED